MSRDPKSFRDVESKLNAPVKKSVFERQKAEAEAKRLKEQRETAAAYEDFVKSFDDQGSDDDDFARPRQSAARVSITGAGAASKRHFSSTLSSAKGSRLSGPGTLGPPPGAFTRKRTNEGSLPNDGMRDVDNDPSQAARAAFQASDDEDDKTQSLADERAAHKPTIHMASLPPGMSPAAIRAVLPTSVTIDNIRVLPMSAPESAERRSMSALVTLASETPASELDSVVSQLQNMYLGRGYYLSLSRHLSSAVLDSAPPISSGLRLPFGAKATAPQAGRGFNPGQARGGRAGIAPPPSLAHAASAVGPGGPLVRVTVAPPSDLKQLKLIHKMIESVILHGPEFEALLMTRPEIQKEERWAWLWDASSAGGIWYRWKLWETLTNANRSRKDSSGRRGVSAQQIFDRSAPWVADEPELPFEHTLALADFVSDPEYNSTEDEDSGDESRRRLQHLQSGPQPLGQAAASVDPEGPSYLNPLRKAKLMHLISRVPETNARLRRGDVARVTGFAIQNAGAGADEVVDLLTVNVLQPFALQERMRNGYGSRDSDAGYAPEEPRQSGPDDSDPSSAKLVALYLISDILSSSSTSGVRHAWRYRQLFEASLGKKRVFEHLGRLEKELKWGRLKAEKWRRAVMSILTLWEGWSVFTTAAQDRFVEVFKNPPLTAEEKAAAETAEQEARRSREAAGRWKTVKGLGEKRDIEADEGRDGDAMETDDDVDGEAMEEDTDEDLDGVPMEEDDDDAAEEPTGAQAMGTEGGNESVGPPTDSAAAQTEGAEPPAGTQKGRPRAADMFGDSEEDE